MPRMALVHRATVGTVTADIICMSGGRPDHQVILPRERFAAEELLMLRDAVELAGLFIRQQEQSVLPTLCPKGGE